MNGLRENDKTDLLTTFGPLRKNTFSWEKPLEIRRDTFRLQEWAVQSWEKIATRQELLYKVQ